VCHLSVRYIGFRLSDASDVVFRHTQKVLVVVNIFTCAAFSVMPHTASARLATDVQNAGDVMVPCFAEELMPVIDSANN